VPAWTGKALSSRLARMGGFRLRVEALSLRLSSATLIERVRKAGGEWGDEGASGAAWLAPGASQARGVAKSRGSIRPAWKVPRFPAPC